MISRINWLHFGRQLDMDMTRGIWIQWNGMVDWNGGIEWNGNKLDISDWFSPPYRPPLNKDHLLIKTTQIQ